MLADYVMTLLKKDQSEDELLGYCKRMLEDFLREHAAPFVDDLFAAVRSGSYLGDDELLPPDGGDDDLGIVEVEVRKGGSKRNLESDDDDVHRYCPGHWNKHNTFKCK